MSASTDVARPANTNTAREHRICAVEGCTNLGHASPRPGKRERVCGKHARERSPVLAASHRLSRIRSDRKRRATGKAAEAGAAQLERGERILNMPRHHAAVRVLLERMLGPEVAAVYEGQSVSRICADDCPQSWLGYKSGVNGRLDYRLCVWRHYAFEPMAWNTARKVQR